MAFEIKTEGKFKYLESREDGPVIMLLHGLFGALSNFSGIINHFGPKYRVIVPLLPIYELPIHLVSLDGLVKHIRDFVQEKKLTKINILGNSLGGHVALLFVLDQQEKINSMCITGSSGLFESAMGSSFPKRGDYEYIKNKTQETFYDPAVASKELVDEVYQITTDRLKAIRIIATAKSAIRHNLADKLDRIKVPTLIIWGKNDGVTPPFVGEKFNELIKGSEIYFLEKCGHAPMMEKPDEFNRILENFLDKHPT
ncbi:MAG: alpha/beta hydrolase [Saprospiraceae bacterium]|nr:alpha/beta hydrolase [Saprospiraceae bacterium]